MVIPQLKRSVIIFYYILEMKISQFDRVLKKISGTLTIIDLNYLIHTLLLKFHVKIIIGALGFGCRFNS